MKKMKQFCAIATMISLSAVAFAEGGNDMNTALEGRTINSQVVAKLTTTKVSLNRATVRELMKVKGIRPNHAKALVSYRKKHGEYKSVEEIAYVKGFKHMKPQTLKSIEEQLTT